MKKIRRCIISFVIFVLDILKYVYSVWISFIIFISGTISLMAFKLAALLLIALFLGADKVLICIALIAAFLLSPYGIIHSLICGRYFVLNYIDKLIYRLESQERELKIRDVYGE